MSLYNSPALCSLLSHGAGGGDVKTTWMPHSALRPPHNTSDILTLSSVIARARAVQL